MRLHKEIKQRSLDWHQIRWAKIGGTGAKELLSQKNDWLEKLSRKMLSERIEEFELEQVFVNDAMQRGIDLEPFAIKEVEMYANTMFEEIGWVENDTLPIGVSPDGLTSDLKTACEVKCFGRKQHLDLILGGEIPDICQVLMYFAIIEPLGKLYWASYRPESKVKTLVVKEFDRNTIVDIGWTEKGKVKEDRGLGLKEYVCENPVLKTVDEWTKIIIERAEKLEGEVKSLEEKISF